MTTLVFGHKSPDTDSTGSALIWAWYLTTIKRTPAEARLLGTPSTEAQFMLERWNLDTPTLLEDLADGTKVVIVDTNNPAELPGNINAAEITAIIDHHRLVGGLETKSAIDITMRPLACTATIMHDLIGADMEQMPKAIKGAMLSCILSDTLEFRSPTTTEHDRAVANSLAADLDISIPDYAGEMFAAKSDVSHLSDTQLLRMDAKTYTLGGKNFRISVLETTAPLSILSRKAGLMAVMEEAVRAGETDQVLLFIVDILNKEATLLVPNALVKTLAEKSFGAVATGDTLLLPGIMSRKKQIIPNLQV